MAYQGHYRKNNKRTPANATEQSEDARRSESFLSRHVKPITFAVCLAVFLALFGPWSIARIKEYWSTDAVIENQMSAEQLKALSTRADKLTWKDFESFYCEVLAEDICYVCSYPVQGNSYTVLVSAVQKGSKIESILVTRRSDFQSIDLLVDDATDFFD